MNCQIKSQKVLAINDGIAKDYNGYQDDKVSGDFLRITYGLQGGNYLYFESDASENFFLKLNFDLTSPTLIFEVNDNNINAVQMNSEVLLLSEQFTITREGFHIGYVFGEGGFQFKRYYKSDWMGVKTYIRTNNGTDGHVFTLDCRHMNTDVWENIYDSVRRFLSRQSY